MSNMNPGSSTPPPPTGAKGGAVIPPPNPPKESWLIALLNLIVAGGLGYILMGQKMKGIVAIVIYLVLLPLTCGTGSAVLAVLTAIDGYMQGELQKQGKNLGEWTFFNDHR